MTRLTIQWRVRPGGPSYRFLPPKDKAWSFCERVSLNWAKRRLAQLRRTLAYRPTFKGMPNFGRHKLFEFRIAPKPDTLSVRQRRPAGSQTTTK